jgi:probable rRNA maturation factor
VDLELDYQIALPGHAQQRAGEQASSTLPTEQQVRDWVCTALAQAKHRQASQLTIRVVDGEEMTQLNQTYRHKDGATNVLSFPFEAPAQVPLPLLGDVVICEPVVAREAQQQNKTLMQHWAHMVVHGVLHLLGYDHITEAQAEQMEQLEIDILSRLGYANPYQTPCQTRETT